MSLWHGSDGDRSSIEVDDRIAEYLRERTDGADLFPTQAIILATYLDEDGDEVWTAHTMGNGRTMKLVGLLEFGKAWLMDSVRAQQGE